MTDIEHDSLHATCNHHPVTHPQLELMRVVSRLFTPEARPNDVRESLGWNRDQLRGHVVTLLDTPYLAGAWDPYDPAFSLTEPGLEFLRGELCDSARMVPHGERGCGCDVAERFFCVLCHRAACWCTGVADQVDEALASLYLAAVPTGDPSVCDECYSALCMGESELVAYEVVVTSETTWSPIEPLVRTAIIATHEQH